MNVHDAVCVHLLVINRAVVVHARLYETTQHKHKKLKPRRCRAPLLPLSPCSERDSYTLEMRLTLNVPRSLPLCEVQSNSIRFLWFVRLFITVQHFHISKAHALHSIPSDRKQEEKNHMASSWFTVTRKGYVLLYMASRLDQLKL